jgi:glutamine cyclotransferase
LLEISTFPTNFGEIIFAFKFNAFCVAVETGLSISAVLLTLVKPTMDASIPYTIPVKCGELSDAYFGEGTTLFKDKIYQLTWKEHKVFIYDVKTLKKVNELYWPYEGWGMTHDDTSIIVNTGGSNIYYVDPQNFSVKKTLGVFNNYGYVSNINELEYVEGKLYANVYMTDNIIQIDPLSGRVMGNLDLSNILIKVGINKDPKSKDTGNVLNGIAYHKLKNTFYITGKNWPVMIELKIRN